MNPQVGLAVGGQLSIPIFIPNGGWRPTHPGLRWYRGTEGTRWQTRSATSGAWTRASGESDPDGVTADRFVLREPVRQQLLRAELERREPGLASEFTRRAARWCDRNGLPEAAIEYGMRAGDAGQVARLVLNIAFSVYHHGRATTLQRWLDWFDDNGLTKRYLAVAVVGAWSHLLAGHPAAAERWADAAAHGSLEEPLPDGSTSLDGWLATLGAAMCRDGVERMGKDAEIALDRLPVASPWRATATLLLAISRQMAGDLDGADVLLARAVEVAEDAGTTETASIALAMRATLAMDREDWNDAERLAERARSCTTPGWTTTSRARSSTQ